MPKINKLILAMGVAAITPAAFAENYDAMSLSDLLNTPVVTSSRQEQKLSQSPSAITVITAEDIKQTGAQTIAEAISVAAGIDLRYGGQNTVGGGILGFDKITINKIALMINGVPWSNEVYSVPNFDAIPVTLSEIKRIEILKGPGSSLYGSGAMLGVVNIITKDTSETQGLYTSYTGGDNRLYMGEVMAGGKVGSNFAYRLTASARSIDQNPAGTASNNAPDFQDYPRLNTTMDYKLADGSKLNFFGSYQKVDDAIWFMPSDMVDTVLSYSKDALTVKGTWQQKHTSFYGSPLRTNTAGLDVQHSFSPFNNNTVVWGANFTQLSADSVILSGMRKFNTGGLFIDDSQKLNDKFTLDLGARWDQHPVTNAQYSGRAAVIYNMNDNNTLRYTWGSSFRNPNFAELYGNVELPTGQDLGGGFGSYFNLVGSSDNTGERAQMHDIGYMGKLSDKWNVSADAFLIKVKDYIDATTTATWYYGPVDTGIPLTETEANLGSATEVGGTLETHYQVTGWLSSMANYTYYSYTSMDSTIGYIMTPQHLVNVQLRSKFSNGLSANLQGHYTSSIQSYAVGAMPNYYTPPSLRVDARVGYDFKAMNHDMTFSVAAWNLLNDSLSYMNSAAGFSFPDNSRRLSATLSCQF